MSPVSRGRKRKPTKAQKAGGRGRRRQTTGEPFGPSAADHEFYLPAYLDDLSPVLPRAEVKDALERRIFAMPYYGTTIGGEDFPRLNPADSDERGTLIQGEHPEYHEALADPGWEGEIDGVNPRLHLDCTKSSPTSCGTVTRLRRGRRPAGCVTVAWTATTCCMS